MKKLLTLAAVAAAMVFASSKASAYTYTYPNVPLTISATVEYGTGVLTTNGTKVTGAPLQTVSFNNKSLITDVTQFEKTNMPAGAYLAWNPESEDIYVTNSSGFSYYPGFYLYVDDDEMTGQASRNLTTDAGTEKDTTAIYFEVDYNSTNYFETYNGAGTLSWTYGKATGTNQPVTLGVNLTFSGSDDCYINGYQGEITSGKISGSGTGTASTDQFPFYYWY